MRRSHERSSARLYPSLPISPYVNKLSVYPIISLAVSCRGNAALTLSHGAIWRENRKELSSIAMLSTTSSILGLAIKESRQGLSSTWYTIILYSRRDFLYRYGERSVSSLQERRVPFSPTDRESVSTTTRNGARYTVFGGFSTWHFVVNELFRTPMFK